MKLKTLAAAVALSAMSLPAFADIMIHEPYARSASPSAMSGAAFMHIMNTGDTADRLIDAYSDAAQKVELHTHIMTDGIANMVHVEEGFVIEAGSAIYLERGGKHVMFMGLNGPFVQDETVSVTLVFENAGEIVIEVPIDLTRMPAMGMEGMDHENMEGMDHGDGQTMEGMDNN